MNTSNQPINILACALLVAVVLVPAVSTTNSAYGDVETSVGNIFQAGVWDLEALAAPVELSAFSLMIVEPPVDEGGEVAGTETEGEEPKVEEPLPKVEVSDEPVEVIEENPVEVEVSEEPLEVVEPAEDPTDEPPPPTETEEEPEPTPEPPPELEEKEEVPEPQEETPAPEPAPAE